MTLRRGFRTEAERRAAEVRTEAGLRPFDPIDLRALAGRNRVSIVSADELIDVTRLHELEAIQSFSFSACTFDLDGSKVIVISPLRSAARQNSDIAHELAHILLGHEMTEVRKIAGVPFRTCRSDQEQEATTLGGTLLLPRPLLLHAVRQGMDAPAIADAYGVTIEMARFRYNTTGVAKQVRRVASQG
jgi:Zn-dependent peptidase ImmA (M78 family)